MPQTNTQIREFHRTWGPATPLHSLPRRIYIKDESQRFGLNAYKILGASWALSQLKLPPGTVVASATSGNHGRGLAHACRRLGLECVVYIAAGANPVRMRRIEREGARIVHVNGNYDASVAACMADAAAHGWTLVQDLGKGDYQQIPELIIEGYSTLFAEAEEQLPEPPETVVVHMGAGNFAAAGLRHWIGRARIVVAKPAPEAVLPDCLILDEPSEGLLDTGVDEWVLITDDDVRQAVQYLADHGIAAGPSGAGGVAGMLKLGVRGPALAVITEGPVVD